MITCPSCGRTSQDLEFCDHCNAALMAPARGRPPIQCPVVPTELTPEQRAQLARPESSIILDTPEGRRRVHWISESDAVHWRPFVDERLNYQLPSLPPCQRIETKDGLWIAAHTTGKEVSPWAGARLLSGPARVRQLILWLPRLVKTLAGLHEHNLVWLTFEPSEIEESPDGWLWLTNMDLAVYPVGSCPERLSARPMFTPPEVWTFQAGDIGPASDVFHLAVFSYYWLAGLLPQGFAGNGPKEFDYDFPPLRLFVPDLPFGIAAVIEQGLEIELRHRFAKPDDFLAALGQAVAAADARHSSAVQVTWDVGAHSRTGKAKIALGSANEDSLVVQHMQDPPRVLLAVADGVTTCDVGSGGLASLLTGLVIENTFDKSSKSAEFSKRIFEACHKSSQSLLAWAMEKGYRELLRAGKDLMGTTVTAAWLEGNQLQVANLGDSRAYLLHGDVVDLLTIDGDLGSGLLATGTAPEEVRAMGLVAKSLRDCIGGCVVNAEGDLEILEEFCRPALSSWTLVPGDVVILCTDGLVEEGAFLGEAELARIIQQSPDLSPKELAVKLSDAAEAKQRLPSALEPDGFGDNITCIVVKIVAARL